MWPPVVRRVTGPLYDRLRLRGGIARAARELRATERGPRAALERLREERLRALVAHARAHAPHYRRTLTADAFAELPLLTKADFTEDLVARDRRRPVWLRRTSGSTGRPTTVRVDPAAVAHHRAAKARARERLGAPFGARWAMVWGHDEPRGLLYAAAVELMENRRVVRVADLDGPRAAETVARLARFRPALLYGFASALQRLAELAPHLPALRAVVSTAEMLPPPAAARLAEAFGVPVGQEYGLTEVQHVAGSCEAGSLHVVEEHVHVEILRDGRPAAPGETGEIVVTDLHGWAAPLVRYRTGDSGAFVAGDCPCGRPHRRLDLRVARSVDLVEVDGRRFHPEVFTPPHGLPCFEALRQIRVLRTGERAFEIEVVLAPGSEAERVAREVETAVRAALPVSGLLLAVRPVPRIERDPSGKLRYYRDVREGR